MLSWYKETSARERKTLRACFGGWALDGMDDQLYSFLKPVLTSLWGLTRGQAGVLAAVDQVGRGNAAHGKVKHRL